MPFRRLLYRIATKSRCYRKEPQSCRFLAYTSTSESSGSSWRRLLATSPWAAQACSRFKPPSPSQRRRWESSTPASVPPSVAAELVMSAWKDWFPVHLYCNPWDLEESVSWIPTLEARKAKFSPGKGVRKRWGQQEAASYEAIKEHAKTLDRVSRHLIQLLQELHAGQTRKSSDRVTTIRCQVVLDELLNFPAVAMDDDHSDAGGAVNAGVWLAGRSERARAILSCMQQFEENGHGTAAFDGSSSLFDVDRRDRQHQGLLRKRTPYAIPRPTRAVYQKVLGIYAEDGAPSWALETVRRMADRHARHGDVELKPGGFHWNCVLLAWENLSSSSPSQALPSSTDAKDDGTALWAKSVHAAKVFLDNIDGMDDSCYNTIMRICGHNHPTEKARALGANVALKIWQDTIERCQHQQQEADQTGVADVDNSLRIPDLSSHFYAFFLQAIRGLPLSNPLRDAYHQAGMQRALEQGKVNAVIVNEFLVHNRSSDLFDKFIGPYYDKREWGGLKPAVASQRILERMPSSWRDRADGISGMPPPS